MKLYCVLGMHRSGTSVVSKMLSSLGASLGPEDDLMPPKPDNPRGFWESMAVTQLHDDLLARFGGRWDAPPFLEPGWEHDPSLDPFRERIASIMTSHFSGPGVAVWKDPRGSLLLPLWRTVTDIAGVIVVARAPTEVVASIRRRDPLSPARALRLWLRYAAEAYRQSDMPLVVHHEDLYEHADQVAVRLAAHCRLGQPEDQALDEIRAFVDDELRGGDEELEDPLLPVARGFHHALHSGTHETLSAFALLIYEYLRLNAEVEYVRDRLTRFVPR